MAIFGWSSLASLLHLLVLLLRSRPAACGTVVKTLPGFSGELPFKLETGYVSVGESEMFYYFVESEGRPHIDPLILYFNGGPGCSALNGFFYQVGPLEFSLSDYEGGIPKLVYYPYSWTKTASILFLDSPVGTGFSYPTTVEDVNTSDSKYAKETYGFLKKWMADHPKFGKVQFFLSSDSYAGFITPILAQFILNDNAAGVEPYINLKGYIGSAPHTDQELQENFLIPFAHRMALISDNLYESLKSSCNGDYVSDTSTACTEALQIYDEVVELINTANILDPECSSLYPKPGEDDEEQRRSMTELQRGFLPSSPHNAFWCRNFMYLLSSIWGGSERVQEALHVRKGSIPYGFYRCSISLVKDHYTRDITTVIPYHKNLTKTGLQVLIFSGDHDMVIPHLTYEYWMGTLGVPIDTDWRPWLVDGQVAGFVRKYAGEGYALTYATVKGAGHSPHEYKRRECYHLFERWIHYYPV